MKAFVILLACLVGFVAAGVLDSTRITGRVPWNENSVEGTDRILRMSRDDLMRQKFLLDLLQHVEQPLLNEELRELSQTMVTDTNQYIGGIDDLMLNTLELCRNQRMLTKDEIFSITDEQALRQMIGLYRILVRSRDWDTFKRNACFARKNINGALFVNALMLAIRDRDDCKMMIMPAINEVLPEMYYDEQLTRKARSIDVNLLTTDTETIKPGLLEMIGLGRRTGQINAGRVNPVVMLDKSQLWMPWREMRMELAMRKLPGQQANVVVRKENKIVLPVEQGNTEETRMSLLTEDVGLKTFVHGLVNDLCLKDDTSRDNIGVTGDSRRLGRVGLERNMGSIIDADMNDRLWRNDNMNMGIRDGRRVVNQMDLNERYVDRDTDRTDRMRALNRKDYVDQMRSTGCTDDMDCRDKINRMRNLGVCTDNIDCLDKLNRMRNTGCTDDMDCRDKINRMRNMGVCTDNIDCMDKLNRLRNTDRVDRRTNIDRIDSMDRRGNIEGVGLDLQGRMQEDERIMNTQQTGKYTNLNRIRDINNLPTTDINSDRLLYVNRRRLMDEQMQDTNTDKTRFMNIVRGGGRIRDGRTVVDRQRDIDMDDENMRMLNRRIINRQRDFDTDMDTDTDSLWLKNLRRISEIDDDLYTMRQQPTRRDRFMNVVNTRDGRRISGRLEDDDSMDVGMRRSNVNNDRWLNIQNRRRLSDVNERDDDELLRGTDRRMGDLSLDEQRDRVRNERLRERVQEMRDEIENEDSLTQDCRGMDTDRCQSRFLDTGRRNRMNIDDIYSGRDVDMSSRRRPRRSLDRMNTINRFSTERQERRGELLLHNLQQLMARITLDRISVGINDLQDTQQNINSLRMNNPRLTGAADERLALRLNEMRLDNRRNRFMLEKINEVEQRLNTMIQQVIRRITGKQDVKDFDKVLGDVLLGKMGTNVDILNILREVLMVTNENITSRQVVTPMDLLLNDPMTQLLVRRIIKVIDRQRQQLGSYNREDISLNGVTINDVVVDRFRTYIDEDDSDLINILDPQVLLAKERVQKMLVARQTRLNHKSFSINVDVTSDRTQQVVMRTFLIPKVDASGRRLDLDEQRLNALLLDTTIVDLNAGRNTIKRKSREITWTARDVTPYTEIYQRVLTAINGDLSMTTERIVGQKCSFPHRLLLPRGRVDGLPMQILVVITPIEGTVRGVRDTLQDDLICGVGTDILTVDNNSLGFPLDRKITNMQQLLTVPNLIIKDVVIYHDDKIRSDIL